jgi:ABC-2 type transport system permease protein
MTTNEQMKVTASANTVPGSLAQVGITVKYTFLDYLRSRRFAILMAITLIISGVLTILVAYYRPPGMVKSTTLDFYQTWWGMFSTDLIVIFGIFFGGDAIAAEFQNKTGYFTIPNPIRRSSIYIGKYIAAFIAATVILVVYFVIAIINGLFYYGASVPYQLGESFLLGWFYLLAVLGFTFMFSSLFKSSSYSILVSFLVLFVGFGIIQGLVEALTNLEPWFILTYGSSIIANVLSVTYPTTSTRFGITIYVASIPEGLAIMGIYFVVTAALGLLLFERKEFN